MLDEVALQQEDALQVVSSGRSEHGIFELVQLVGDAVEDRELGVDEAVRHEVIHEVDAALEPLGLAAEPAPHRGERRDLPGVDRDQEALAEERVQLEQLEVVHPLVLASEALRDEEQVVSVLLHLGPLIEVRAVLDGQRMEVEPGPQQLELGRIRSVQVDPAQHTRRRTLHTLATLGQLDPSVPELHHAKHTDPIIEQFPGPRRRGDDGELPDARISILG